MGRLPLLFFQTFRSTLRLSIIAQYHPEMSSVKPLVLHAHGTGPNPYKVACVLESLGVPYEVKLGPRGNDEQAIVDFEKWNFFLVSTLGPFMGQVNWFRHYHSKKNDDAVERYEAQAYRCFEVLEGQLKHGGQWILPGDGPSAVDFHFYPWVYQHGFAGLSLDQYPTVAKWVKNVNELKEVKSAYEKVAKGQQM